MEQRRENKWEEETRSRDRRLVGVEVEGIRVNELGVSARGTRVLFLLAAL